MKEPQIHSHIEDCLPDDHGLAWQSVGCASCGTWVHASNNECMQTWVECGRGNFCMRCFAGLPDVEALDDDLGLGD